MENAWTVAAAGGQKLSTTRTRPRRVVLSPATTGRMIRGYGGATVTWSPVMERDYDHEGLVVAIRLGHAETDRYLDFVAARPER
jgi:hypothetical protein